MTQHFMQQLKLSLPWVAHGHRKAPWRDRQRYTRYLTRQKRWVTMPNRLVYLPSGPCAFKRSHVPLQASQNHAQAGLLKPKLMHNQALQAAYGTTSRLMMKMKKIIPFLLHHSLL
jgi:hypothetical protein